MTGRIRGGATRSSTRSTSAASPTTTVTVSATSLGCGRACRTCATSASTPSGSPGTLPDGRRRLRRGRLSGDRLQFGTMEDALAFIDDAHAHDIRVLLDIVPNHTSDQHPWPRWRWRARPAAASANGTSSATARAAVASDSLTDWPSVSAGRPGRASPNAAAARPVVPALFAPRTARPRLDRARGRREFESILRFWYERGVDGFRIDVAHGLVKDPTFLDLRGISPKSLVKPGPYWDQDGVHDVYRLLAGDRRRVRRPPVRGRGLRASAERPPAISARRVAHGIRFPALQAGWDAGGRAERDRRQPSLARAGRRRRPGCSEPRSGPPRHAARPASARETGALGAAGAGVATPDPPTSSSVVDGRARPCC